MNSDLQKEILNVRNSMEKLADKNMKPILQAYKRSLNRVREDIAKIYIEYAVDGQLQISKQQRYAVLKQLEKKLLQQAKELGHIDLGHTTKILEEVYRESFYRTAFTIQSGMDAIIDFSILKPEFVKVAVEIPIKGEMFSSRIWTNKEKLVNSLREQIERGMIQGDSIDKMARRIKDEFGATSYQSKRLINSEMARCMTRAQDEAYRESGLVEQVMFNATLDEKTSDVCQSYDGMIFSLDDYPKIPEDTHPNCRSCIIPVIENWSPTVKRENIKGEDGVKPIIEYTDYKTWRKNREG